MNTNISSQIEAIRDALTKASGTAHVGLQVGNILIALAAVTDLIEQTNKRIDALDDWREQLTRRMP